MSNLPVSSRLKAPTSRIAKTVTAKSEGIPTPRASGSKPSGSSTSSETPQHKSGLKQPLLKRSAGIQETEKTEKKSGLSSVGSSITTPRGQQNGPQSKLKSGLPSRSSDSHTPLKRENFVPRDSSSTNLKQKSFGSQNSLNKEAPTPGLRREKTQESIKDVETGILFKVGDRVLVAGTKSGVIEYLGETKFAKGLWAGIKLDEADGKNDGSVAGVRYFDCEPLHGVFSKPNRLHKINIVPKNSISDDSSLDDSNVLKIGDMVIVGGTKLGILRYLGPTEFAKGEWAGVELDEPLGKNDGAVAGTRYFTCEMKYGLFAPSSKVTKSKKQALSKKSSHLPGPSLATAAKSVFNRAPSPNPDVSDAALHTLPVKSSDSLHFKDNGPVNDSQEVKTSNESLHSAVKKTPSTSLQVVALQSALEEREREIHKMLMEREMEKEEKLKGIEGQDVGRDSAAQEQLLKEKDDMINSLKQDLEKSRKENSIIQSKLDEEAKKYEDLQFMLEEEKITDDELMDHVKKDEHKIKELSSQTEERNMKILELQRELREVRSDKLSNEAKMIELRDQLAESRTKFENLKSNLGTTVQGDEQGDAQEMETLLKSVKEELNETKRELTEKARKVNELERQLSEKTKKEHEVEVERKMELEEKLSTAEATVVDLKSKISKLEVELSNSRSKVEELDFYVNNVAMEKDISESKAKELENTLASAKKQLEESREESRAKSQHVNDLENRLNTQLSRQKEIEKEVECLGEADKNLTLLKEVHRAEVETLQSRLSSLTENLNEERKKLQALTQEHEGKMDLMKNEKAEELKKLNEMIDTLKARSSKLSSDCQIFASEKNKAMEEVSALKGNLGISEEKLNSMGEKMEKLQKKYDQLSQVNSGLSAERNDVIQLCEEQDRQLEILKTENTQIVSERDLLRKESDDLSQKMVSLESQINALNSQNSQLNRKQGEQDRALETEITRLKSQLDNALNEKSGSDGAINALSEEKKKLENDVAAKNNEISKLQNDHQKLTSLSQELEAQVNKLKKKIGVAAENASHKTESLSDEILILKDDLEEATYALKQKEDDIRLYREQIEKMGNDGLPRSPMDGDILENASTLLIRLHEAESKLAVVQSEKETADEQVEFLNSIIVDLQNKNQKANQTIALLEAGDEAILLHGLESESDDEAASKPKFSMRKFCDICDVFDEHETDECPLQESGDDSGIQHHGDRNFERPYCGICEVFGHWSEDCNDEQTF